MLVIRVLALEKKSIINGSEIKVSKSKIGIVSKDKSSATFNKVILKNMNTGFAVYQKKRRVWQCRITYQ